MSSPNSSGEPASPRANLVSDFLASIVVFMVALPLCIGIAQACGLPPEAGIVTGIVGGILVGALAGSPLQVSGPAAGLIVLVIQFLDDAHQKGHAGAAAVVLLGITIFIAGIMQIVAGLLRAGQWFRAVSPSVVEGMLAGIGLTIIAKQIHDVVDDNPPKEVLEGLLTIPNAISKAIYPPPGSSINHQEAAIIGVMTITVLAMWKLLKPKVFKFIPSAVVAILLAVLVNEFGRPVFQSLGIPVGPAVDNHGGLGVERVKVSSDLLDSLAFIRWPGWEILFTGLIWKAAATFALIASAETLLCAVAVDGMHNGKRTNFDKELMAQGAGNMVCGALGALPMTGVIVRSSANVDAGAKTRLSAILHGFWLLLFVTLLPELLSRIPQAALAAVLVYTGWKLLNLHGLFKLWKQSRSEAVIFVVTAATIVGSDLLAGVITGVVLSAARLLWMFSSLSIQREDDPENDRILLHLDGAATFIRLPVLASELETVPPKKNLHIHLSRLQFVDHAILTMLSSFQKQYESTGGRVFLDWDRLNAQFNTKSAMQTGGNSTVLPKTAATDSRQSKDAYTSVH